MALSETMVKELRTAVVRLRSQIAAVQAQGEFVAADLAQAQDPARRKALQAQADALAAQTITLGGGLSAALAALAA